MPRTKPPRHIANAIKDLGTSKARTREISDQTRAGPVRRAVRETATGQRGSTRRGGRPRGPHPSNHGGVHPDTPELELQDRAARRRPGEAREQSAGLTRGPARSRVGSRAAGGRLRSGGSGKGRRKARGGSRTRVARSKHSR
jgi:hypothetical protein